jgi:hypothetical protein
MRLEYPANYSLPIEKDVNVWRRMSKRLAQVGSFVARHPVKAWSVIRNITQQHDPIDVVILAFLTQSIAQRVILTHAILENSKAQIYLPAIIV